VTTLLLAAAIWTANLGGLAYLGVLFFAIHLIWQVKHVNIVDGRGALRLFRSNRDAGLILFVGLALDAAVRHFGV